MVLTSTRHQHDIMFLGDHERTPDAERAASEASNKTAGLLADFNGHKQDRLLSECIGAVLILSFPEGASPSTFEASSRKQS